MNSARIFDKARNRAESTMPSILELSHSLHDEPEISFEEVKSSAKLVSYLTSSGFSVERPFSAIPTSFVATFGHGLDVVSICAEYDALPEIGHACGHNIIASAALVAGVALAEVADELDITVKVLGTPAEEHGGGKVLMLQEGAWDDSLFSMMVHPTPSEHRNPVGDQSMLGVDRFRAEYVGLASHAAAAPTQGINAANAAVIAQVAIGLLRQQLPEGTRVAAVTTESGSVTNIIPGIAAIEVEVRSSSLEELRDLRRQVTNCLQAGALATGCKVEITQSEPTYEPLLQEPTLGKLWVESLRLLGEKVSGPPTSIGGSTDMGNVSNRVASIHPMVGLVGTRAPIHSAEFARQTRTPAADHLIQVSGLAMARTAIAALANPEIRFALQRARAERPAPSTT